MIDNTDKDILNVLLDNSRLSYRQIAKKIGRSVATVMHRVKRLEQDEIIRKYTVSLDYEKLGYDTPVIINFRVAKGKAISVGKGIALNPNIVSMYDVTGDFDVTLYALFKSRAQLDKFIKELPKHEDVTRIYTKLIMNTIKEDNIKIRD